MTIPKLHYVWALFAIGLVTTAYSQKPRNEEQHFISKTSNQQMGFLLYRPKDYKPNTVYPLMVFLHGSGSVGSDLARVKTDGIPRLIEEGQDFPFIVISPQLPLNTENRWLPEFVDEFVKYAQKTYPVNPNRIYMTGFSAGATGVWEYSCAFPSKVACAVPISGWGDKESVCKMKNVPTWVFHGTKDLSVGPVGSRNLTNKLKSCGGDVRLTELPNAGHDDAWRLVYAYPGLMGWISSKNRADTVARKTKVKVNVEPTAKGVKGPEMFAFKLPKVLYQITGLDCSSSGQFYGIEGSNKQPAILRFDTLGQINGVTRIKDASNISWQDLTRGNNGYVYVADVGNDLFKRTFFQIYKIKETDLDHLSAAAGEVIEFKLDAGKQLNFKSIFFMDNALYLFGESANKQLYLVQVADQPGTTVSAITLGEFSKLGMPSITSATFDERSKSLYLLDKRQIGIVKMTNGIQSLKGGLSSVIDLQFESLKEGLTRLPNGNFAFADQNFLGATDGNLYLTGIK